MQVKQLMSARPEYLDANATIREAALRMADEDRGFTPVADGEKLVGVLTDRDIALRAFANGKTGDDSVSSIMSGKVLYCYEDDDVKSVLKNMQDQGVQRLIVLDNESDKDFVGVVTLSDIADKCDAGDSELARELINCCRHYH